ncbi:hypothetical protein Pcinc_041684 [Petrolisthes cinctipes]|uniref:Uncharacterized protein n=1 Tax=Petrolisthes cinctipes TaxID=88211 RepID=A0AAE1EI44_PETCI|nr:hypothetical protein Pcinc_041684 [Petrolisthes cinctipes]
MREDNNCGRDVGNCRREAKGNSGSSSSSKSSSGGEDDEIRGKMRRGRTEGMMVGRRGGKDKQEKDLRRDCGDE